MCWIYAVQQKHCCFLTISIWSRAIWFPLHVSRSFLYRLRSFCFHEKFKLIFVGGNFSIYYQTKWFYCYDYGYTMIFVTLFPLFSFYCYCCYFWLLLSLLSSSPSSSPYELIRVIRWACVDWLKRWKPWKLSAQQHVLTNNSNKK